MGSTFCPLILLAHFSIFEFRALIFHTPCYTSLKDLEIWEWSTKYLQIFLFFIESPVLFPAFSSFLKVIEEVQRFTYGTEGKVSFSTRFSFMKKEKFFPFHSFISNKPKRGIERFWSLKSVGFSWIKFRTLLSLKCYSGSRLSQFQAFIPLSSSDFQVFHSTASTFFQCCDLSFLLHWLL